MRIRQQQKKENKKEIIIGKRGGVETKISKLNSCFFLF